ncbi:hypothetical protein Tco_1254221 [Tanacetum coccineum]
MSQIDRMDSTNAKCCRALLVFDKWRCDDLASRPSQATIEEKTTIIHIIPTKNANKDDIQKLIPAEVSPEIQRLLTLLQKFHGEWREDILKDQVPSKDLKTKPSLDDEILSRPTSMDDEMLPRLTDTSSAQARTAKDIQEISWERFPLSVDTVDKEREKRLRKKEKKAGGGQGKNIKKKTQKPPAHFFSKQLKPKPIPPPLINRNMKRWQHGVYLMSNYSIMHWSSLSQNLNETLNSCGDMIHTEKHGGSLLEGFPQIQINTLAVNDDFLVAGGFQRELAFKSVGVKITLSEPNPVCPDSNSLGQFFTSLHAQTVLLIHVAGADKRANAAAVADAKNALITMLKHIRQAL